MIYLNLMACIISASQGLLSRYTLGNNNKKGDNNGDNDGDNDEDNNNHDDKDDYNDGDNNRDNDDDNDDEDNDDDDDDDECDDNDVASVTFEFLKFGTNHIFFAVKAGRKQTQ